MSERIGERAGMWRPSMIMVAPAPYTCAINDPHAPHGPCPGKPVLRPWPEGVTEADMIRELGEKFGLGEDDLIATAAATARVHNTRISDVIEAGWHDWCEDHE